MEVASSLEMNRVIPNRYTFFLKVQLMNYKILAGTYILNTAMTYDEILDQITNYANAIEREE
jgi:cell division protein YceG involved in septum cleavage